VVFQLNASVFIRAEVMKADDNFGIQLKCQRGYLISNLVAIVLCYYCDCYAFSGLILYESSQASNEVGANYSAYRIRSFVGAVSQLKPP